MLVDDLRSFTALLALAWSLPLAGGCRGDDAPSDELGGTETAGDGDGDGELLDPAIDLVRADGSALDPATEPVPLGARIQLRFAAPIAEPARAVIAAELALVDARGAALPTARIWSADATTLEVVPRGLLDAQADYELRTGAAVPELTATALASRVFGFRTKLRSDFDGDGFADLVVAAPRRAANGIDAVGAVMVHRGSASGVSTSASLVLVGVDEAEDSFGHSHAAVDLDGDGFDDLVVGAPGRGDFAGVVEVRYGSAAGLASDPDLVLPGLPHETFGARVAGIGDVDGDGFEDLALAAPRAPSGAETSVGRVEIHYGGAAGIVAAADLELLGDAGGDEYGTWMAAGDFDDDGFDDLVVCAPDHDLNRGLARIVPGSATGLQVDPGATVSLVGENVQDNFCTLPAVADVDGDGIDDLAIGAAGWVEGVGAVAVYPGSAAGLDPAQFDRLIGDAQPDLFGFVAAAGDLDGDGDDELLIGAPYASAGSRDGAAYVHDGGPGGPAQVPSAVWTGSDAELFGLVYPSLDLDGDGQLDAIIAAPGYASRTGRVLIFPGDGAGFAATAAVILTGAGPEEWFGDYLPLT